MKPILYEYDEVDFTSNGIGRLNPSRCIVTEERNGQFELEMDISIEDKHYADIREGRILYAPHDDTKTRQPFEIYMISRPMGGVVTVNAHHISYRTAKITVMPCSAGSAVAALQALKTNSVTEHPFVFNTDLLTEASFHVDRPETMRSRFAGVEGSILDVYGGEYEWDKFTIYLRSARGSDTDVILRYGKNITSLCKTTDATNTWTGIVPYWFGTDGESGAEDLVTLPEKTVLIDDDSSMLIPLDMSSYFNQKPTVAELRQKATKYVQDNAPTVIPTSIDVSFVQLWQTQEYANVAPMERLRLCDTLTIKHEKLGVSNTAKVVKTVYNVLLERYESMTVGTVRPSMGDAINEATSDIRKNIVRRSTMQAMIEAMANLMQGGLGGHMVVNTDNNGKPNELLFMDTEDKNTAVKVLRINMNGIAFSRTGYNGPFHTAWSIDGTFYADWIAAGNLDATLLTVGIIKDVLNKNSWDLATGMLITTLALIGGIHVGADSIYSGDHSTIDSTQTGFYLGSNGTLSIGDGNQYIKYKMVEPDPSSVETFGDGEGEEQVVTPTYALEMLLDSLVIGPSQKSITDTTFDQIDDNIADAAGTATNYLHYSAQNGLVVSQTGSAGGSNEKPYNTQITDAGINFRKKAVILASMTGTVLTFFRGLTGLKGAEFGATDLTFYKPDGTTEAAKIGANGLDVLEGVIGGFEVNSSLFQSIHTEANNDKYRVIIRKPVDPETKVVHLSKKRNTDNVYKDTAYISNNGKFYTREAVDFASENDLYFVKINAATASTPASSSFNLGSIQSNGSGTKIDNLYATTSGHLLRIVYPDLSTIGQIYYESSSSRRYKNHVCDMPFDYAKKILDIMPVLFRYKDGYLADGDECEGKDVPGFYAEDVEKCFPLGVYHNADGSVENWKPDRLIPAMLRVIQEQQKEIDYLMNAIDQIKGAVGI